MKSQTLVILTPGFPENEEDTTCLPAFQQFALSLHKLYPEKALTVVSLQYPFAKREYMWCGIKVIALGGANKPGVHRFYTWIKAFRVLTNLKKTAGIFGIISLWLSECSLVGKYFSAMYGTRHYMWLIGQDAKASNQYIKRIRPKGKEIIAMSDFLKEEYAQNHKEVPFLVVENGINASAFPALNKDNRTIDIIGVGSLTELKNYKLFIGIIVEVKKTFPNIKAAIAGAGPQENELKEFIKQLKLEDNVELKGLVQHSGVFDLMNNSKIFLHTSTYEGNSTVLMEALYSGCITFSTCPLSNSVTPNLFILENKEEFVTGIIESLRNYSEPKDRVTFNTMDRSAKRIMELFIGS